MRYKHFFLLLLCASLLTACAETQTADEVQEAEPTQTEPAIYTEEVDYTVGEASLKGFLAYDANQEGQRPGVLVVHEWWGHNDYARRRARMLAELGYTAFSLDMYGDGKVANHPDDARAFMEEVAGNMEVGQQRFEAALDLLKNHETTDPERVAAIGYCFGGGVVLAMARQGLDLDGVVSFHGLSAEASTEPGSVKARVLACIGDSDPFIPSETVEAFKQEMESAQVDYELMVFEGVQHSFTSPEADSMGALFEMPLAYDAEADQQSWDQMQAFFKEIFE